MRTKLFISFIFIILLALLSGLVFERLIIKDFNEFIKGTAEDHIYWIMASIEGSYEAGTWDEFSLNESLHWGVMLGFESFIEDVSGNRIRSSAEIISSMNPNMKKRMSSLLDLSGATGDFTWYPLFVEGEEIGKLYVRPIKKLGSVPVKEEIFRKRGKEFLLISFMIAGGGALILSLFFTVFLSNPIRKLTGAADKIATGDFLVEGPKSAGRFRDEIDRLTDSFNYMAEALRREDSLRKHLTSNIAHELRTPLTIIKGNLEAIEDGVISDSDKVLENIKLEIERIISLVEGIEDITNAEASFFERGVMEVVDLKEFIESIAGGMRKLIMEKGLDLKTEGPSVVINTYPEKLHIILKNLLVNAYKFTKAGMITISWEERRQDGEEGFSISVKDTGIGIPEDDISKVFERFYKDKSSGGKGLGLAIVSELVDVMGGRIEVKSAPDEGSTFTVIF